MSALPTGRVDTFRLVGQSAPVLRCALVRALFVRGSAVWSIVSKYVSVFGWMAETLTRRLRAFNMMVSRPIGTTFAYQDRGTHDRPDVSTIDCATTARGRFDVSAASADGGYRRARPGVKTLPMSGVLASEILDIVSVVHVGPVHPPVCIEGNTVWVCG
jgi:hypothetical protein